MGCAWVRPPALKRDLGGAQRKGLDTVKGMGKLMAMSAPAPVDEPVALLPRSAERMSRETFSLILSLTDQQPWLKLKQDALTALIEECQNHEQQILVCELLHRLTYLDGNTFPSAIQRICDYIQVDLGLTPKNTAICASDTSGYADSSQFVVYSLKNANWQSLDWNTSSFIAGLGKIAGTGHKPVLVIVDEFVGTGETAEKTIKWVSDKLTAAGLSTEIHYAAVAGMASGLKRIKPLVASVFSTVELSKGISDFYCGAEVANKTAAMLLLEQGLNKQGRRGKLSKHSLGYKGSEALYARSNGNTPNNVFPIFWWEVDSQGGQRNTVLKNI